MIRKYFWQIFNEKQNVHRKGLFSENLTRRKNFPAVQIFGILYSFVKLSGLIYKTWEAIILVVKSLYYFRFLIKDDNYKIIMFLIRNIFIY